MFYVKWKGKRLELTLSARQELVELGLEMLDILDVLENGFNCSKSRREKETIEKCIVKGKKLLRVVVKEYDHVYDTGEIGDIFNVVHIGKENRTQEKFKKNEN